MKTITLNERQILENAWNGYIENYSKGWSFESAYNHAKVEAHNDAIRSEWKAQEDAKRKAEIEAENAEFATSGMDFHTYTMSNNYASSAYNGD